VPDVRARVIALCRRGFKPVAVVAWTKPEEERPHPVAQGVLEAFLERSAGRYGRIDTVLAALFADAVDVGVLRAGVVYEDGRPVGLCRFDARFVPRIHRGFIGEPARGLVTFFVDAWEHILAEKRAQMVAPLAEQDAVTDSPLEALVAVGDALFGATLVVAGFRQHARGQWRRRCG
jgi:hypothetical protein